MNPPLAPDRGDVVWLDFDPQVGREQAGRRPALVLTDVRYNSRSGLVVVCPITTRAKGYPFEVAIPVGLPISSVVLADQMKSQAWAERRAVYICTVPPTVVAQVIAAVDRLIR